MRPLIALLLLLSGCGPHWLLVLDHLDRVPLSVLQLDSQIFISGGPLGSAGNGLFARYDGHAWTAAPTGSAATLWWVSGFDRNTVFAVGENGAILRWDGAALTPETSPTTATLFGVWGASPTDIWAVGGRPDLGGDGVILHRDANGWTAMSPPMRGITYFKVWGNAANDVFICGQGGTILHWDGAAWSPMATGLGPATPLFTVAGTSGRDVYAVGGTNAAVALHYDGAAWRALDDPAFAAAAGLAGVAVDSDGTLVFVGGNGTVVRGKPGALADESGRATIADLHAASIRGGEVFTVGGNYFAQAPAPRIGVVAHYGGDVGKAFNP